MQHKTARPVSKEGQNIDQHNKENLCVPIVKQ